jgi:hypothetical protein
MAQFKSIAYVRAVSFTAGAHDIVARRRHDDTPRTQGEIFTTYDWAIGLHSGRDLSNLNAFLKAAYSGHRIIRITPAGHHWDKDVPVISLERLQHLSFGEAETAPAVIEKAESLHS